LKNIKIPKIQFPNSIIANIFGVEPTKKIQHPNQQFSSYSKIPTSKPINRQRFQNSNQPKTLPLTTSGGLHK
jgi:hypothetical protein